MIRALNKSRQENMRTSFDLVTEFVKSSERILSPFVMDSHQQSTHRCWQLLRSILHGRSSKSKPLLEQQYSEAYQEGPEELSLFFAEESRQILDSLFKTYLLRCVEASKSNANANVVEDSRAETVGLLR